MRQRQATKDTILNTGFGTNSSVEGGRLTNKDGSVNLRKTGLPFWRAISLYHSILRLSPFKFLLSIFIVYAFLNLFFAAIYILIGVEHLQGVSSLDGDGMGNFLHAFFFSSQTLTTVGYGHISPEGTATNIAAAIESFVGILSFALVTGLLYGRFSRPKAFLMFSQNAIIAPYKDMTALMCRLITYKNNHLTDVEAEVTVAMRVMENGQRMTRFYPLKLEIKKVNSLALNWTLVHSIDEDSPLYEMSAEAMKATDIEVIIFIRGFDDHFSNIVQQRTSYTASEVVYGAKFLPMYKRSDDGSATILEIDKINAMERVQL